MSRGGRLMYMPRPTFYVEKNCNYEFYQWLKCNCNCFNFLIYNSTSTNTYVSFWFGKTHINYKFLYFNQNKLVMSTNTCYFFSQNKHDRCSHNWQLIHIQYNYNIIKCCFKWFFFFLLYNHLLQVSLLNKIQ